VIEGVDGIATLGKRELDVMVWNYREENVGGPSRKVSVEIGGVRPLAGEVKVEEFRVDGENSNSYAAWRKMGSPQNPTARQYAELEAAGRLKRVGTPKLAHTSAGDYVITLDLPEQGVSLLRLRW
jgi:xylan 1,4-beta-xylosidase